MSVIADFPGYPGWAGVRSAEVVDPGEQGRARMVRFELAIGMLRDRFVLGYEWHGDERVRWELAEQGTLLSEMSGAYILADRDAGTEVTFARRRRPHPGDGLAQAPGRAGCHQRRAQRPEVARRSRGGQLGGLTGAQRAGRA